MQSVCWLDCMRAQSMVLCGGALCTCPTMSLVELNGCCLSAALMMLALACRVCVCVYAQAKSESPNASLNDTYATTASTSSALDKDSTKALIQDVFLVGALALEGFKVPTRMCNAVQALLAPSALPEVLPQLPPLASAQPGDDDEDAERKHGEERLVQSAGAVTVEQELQGHVLVALGKLAVHDASLSSKMAALFLREVERAASPVLRNNLLIILTDICVRFTSLVGENTHAHEAASGRQGRALRRGSRRRALAELSGRSMPERPGRVTPEPAAGVSKGGRGGEV